MVTVAVCSVHAAEKVLAKGTPIYIGVPIPEVLFYSIQCYFRFLLVNNTRTVNGALWINT